MKNLIKSVGLATTVLLISGCASFNYVEEDAPIAEERISPLQNKPKVAVVLGSGGPRGYAHIGILKVLEEHNIPIDLVVGSSVGSLVGSFWAAGYSAETVSRLSKEGGPLTLFDFSLFADRGWIIGQRLQDYVNQGVGHATIEELDRELIIVATRREDNRPVYFRKGNVGVAVRASSAVPGVFSPVAINNIEYVDADESLPVAVEVARQAGAEFIIAIDVSARKGAAPTGTSERKLLKDARRRARIEPQVAMADFLFHPDLDYDAGPWRSYFIAAEIQGEAAANHRIDELKALLDQSIAINENQVGNANVSSKGS